MIRPLVGFVISAVFAAHTGGQVRRPQLAPAQAAQFEAALRANPNDQAARGALLDYYFLNSALNAAEAIPARRRHILWLIENSPASDLAGLPAATIDTSGHRLADPQGFKLSSDAWKAQIAKPGASAMALANAARFFKLSDKEFTISLLERALGLEPVNKEIGARLGDEYALAIMGVTMVNNNGYPMAVDPSFTASAAALKSREALNASRNPYALAKAGYQLSWQGAVLYYSRKLSFDPAPLAESALQRAVSLAPNEREIAVLLEEHHKMQQQLPGGSPQRVVNSPAPPPRAAAPAPAPTPRVTAEDLKQVAVGMKREQLLKLGPPAGRMTTTEDGHVIEVFQYSADGRRTGKVRLTDGTVSSIELP